MKCCKRRSSSHVDKLLEVAAEADCETTLSVIEAAEETSLPLTIPGVTIRSCDGGGARDAST